MASLSIDASSVQDLVSKNLKTIPSRYIRPEIDGEIVVTSIDNEVPVIDLSKLILDGNKGGFSNEEMKKLHLACQEWGFFQLVNHGVDEEAMKKMVEDVREFFELPVELKKECSSEIEGYGQAFVLSEEQKLDWGDMLYFFTRPDSARNYKVWPAHRPLTFRETVNKYSSEMERMKTILVGLMAKNLGIDQDKFIDLFKDGLQSTRLNYYPPCPDPSKVLGISPHSDATGITILLQLNEVDGLQIRHDGNWVPVKMLPSALLVNIGDVIEILSNGIYKSIEHRVVINKEKERISVATFHEAHKSVLVGPLPELIVDGETEMYRSVTSDEFLKLILSQKLDGKSLLDNLKLKNE
ncbi:hypothetical protein Scep_023512 [Stephania cephalantha]|uniref:Fe2OG dioxygenase domain-containing protein n=1 Tax=Stephania cephalantha TaxID=152367 RepID=A0AAP0F085_9MAGN